MPTGGKLRRKTSLLTLSFPSFTPACFRPLPPLLYLLTSPPPLTAPPPPSPRRPFSSCNRDSPRYVITAELVTHATTYVLGTIITCEEKENEREKGDEKRNSWRDRAWTVLTSDDYPINRSRRGKLIRSA